MPALPTGAILLWSGSIASIPAGYVLCNGANGSPDLRNKFIIGAGSTYNPDDTGGAAVHNHDFTGDGHTHNIAAGANIATGAGYATQTDSIPGAGTTDNTSTLPPYYALAYIMKT